MNFLTRIKKTSILVFFISVVLLLLFSGFDSEAFLEDDVRTQFAPVYEEAYKEFFDNGRIPTYNFFQLKGFSVANEGYYSIMNPLMLLSYAIAHVGIVQFSTTTIYLALMFALGNMIFFLLAKEFNKSLSWSILLTMCYSSTAVFVYFSAWYYVFNNHVFIPLLILIFWKTKDTWIQYFGCGIVLSLEILFGNIQYSCYHYIIYGIIGFSFALFYKKKLIILFTNIIVALVLSSPFILLAIRASQNFKNDEFFSWKIGLADLLLIAFIPASILEKIGAVSRVTADYIRSQDSIFWCYNGAGIFLLICSIINWLKNFAFKVFYNRRMQEDKTKLKEKFNDKSKLIISLALIILFFYSFGSDGIVAKILSYLPVFNQFRYLIKCIFVIIPLIMIVISIYAPGSIFKSGLFENVIKVVCLLFCVVGYVNIFFLESRKSNLLRDLDKMTYKEQLAESQNIINKSEIDINNYRSITLMYDMNIQREEYHSWQAFTSNYPTGIHAFVLGAYEVTADREVLKEFDSIYNPDKIETFILGAGLKSYFINSLQNNKEKLANQLKDNGIRYIFVQKDLNIDMIFKQRDGDNIALYNESINDSSTDDIVDLLNLLPEIQVLRVIPVSEYYDIIEISGSNSLCMDEAGNRVNLLVEHMDTVHFNSYDYGEKKYNLSFHYIEGLNAYIIDKNTNNKLQLQVEKENNGNLVILKPEGLTGEIYLEYKDFLRNLGFLFEVLIVISFIALIYFLLKKKQACSK